MRIGQFDRITPRITEIDRTGAVRPQEIRLYFNAMSNQMTAPAIQRVRRHGKAEMAGATRSMRRDRQSGTGIGGFFRRNGPEDQKHLRSGAFRNTEKDMPSGFGDNLFESHDAGPEIFRSMQVIRVKSGFQRAENRRR